MRNHVDLHLHSAASDGRYAPAALVRLSLEQGLRVIALTDHDTTGGVREALIAARGTLLEVIPGVELSTDADTPFELHILGYHIDYKDLSLQQKLSSLQRSRSDRAKRMIELLKEHGYPVSWQRVSDLAGGDSMGRPHIAQAMVEASYVDSVEMAFRHYLGRDGLAYVPRAKLAPQEAIGLILNTGGIPVLAHPRRIIEWIPALVRAGLMGLETYYHDYSEPEIKFLTNLARKHNLILTGGTDFHGAGVTGATAPGTTYVPMSVAQELDRANRKPT